MPTSASQHDKAQIWSAVDSEKTEKRNRTSRINCCGDCYSFLPIALSVIAFFLAAGTIFGVGIRWHQMAEEITQLRLKMNESEITQALLSAQIMTTAPPTKPQLDFGSTYIRWGKKTCPDDNDLVYSGFGAGSSSHSTTHAGGGAGYLCMPPKPEYNKFDKSNDSLAYSWIYGAEYLSYVGYGIFNDNVHGHNVACSVCLSPRISKTMIPAQISCPIGWTREYFGYLMSSYVTTNKMSFECVDEKPDVIAGTGNITGGAQLYFVSAYCGESGVNHCPPYINAQELTCVICTK